MGANNKAMREAPMEASNQKAVVDAIVQMHRRAKLFEEGYATPKKKQYTKEDIAVELHRCAAMVEYAYNTKPRNCDIYKTKDEAKKAFLAYKNKVCESYYDLGDLKYNYDGLTEEYAEWLLEGAKDGNQ